jgi:type IV secretory pathway VirB3-like protein
MHVHTHTGERQTSRIRRCKSTVRVQPNLRSGDGPYSTWQCPRTIKGVPSVCVLSSMYIECVYIHTQSHVFVCVCVCIMYIRRCTQVVQSLFYNITTQKHSSVCARARTCRDNISPTHNNPHTYTHHARTHARTHTHTHTHTHTLTAFCWVSISSRRRPLSSHVVGSSSESAAPAKLIGLGFRA